VNHFKGLGAQSLRALEKALKEQLATETRRLTHLAVKEMAVAKDPTSLLAVISRQAGRVDAVDNLLTLIYDASKP
jgi:hypothetical protein